MSLNDYIYWQTLQETGKTPEEVYEYKHPEVVRCKECKFSESVITSWSTDGKNNVVERLCKVHKWSVKDDDYCSYGEREEFEEPNYYDPALWE